MRTLVHFVLTALAALAIVATPVAASAQSVEERVEMLLGDAYADYDMLQLDAAEDKLFQALDLVEEYGIRTPGAAGTYIMLGVVWAARSGDAWDAYDVFYDGLLLDPYAEIHPYYATPSLVEVLEEVRLEIPDSAYDYQEPYEEPYQEPYQEPYEEPYVEPTPPAPTTPARTLSHTPVREANGGRPLPVQATVAVTAPVQQVSLYYRPFGQTGYSSVDMRAGGDGTTFTADIPGNASRGVISLDYYIEALDRTGAFLDGSGTATQPHTVFVLGSDGPSPSRTTRTRNRSRSGGDGEVFHLSLGVGSGIGLATAEPNVYADDVELNPGLAPTPLHLAFELGFAPGRGAFHIVPFGRMQLVFLDSGVELEPLFGVKARYFFRDDQRVRVYGQGGAGYGYVSHLVQLAEIDDGTFDTTNEGPIHVGGGVGFVFMATDHFGIQVDSYLMAMFPDFSLQVDAQLGAYIAF